MQWKIANTIFTPLHQISLKKLAKKIEMYPSQNHVSSPAQCRAKLQEDKSHARNHLEAKAGKPVACQTLKKVANLDNQLTDCWSISLKCRMSLNPSATHRKKKFKRNNTNETLIKTMSVLKTWTKAAKKDRKDSSLLRTLEILKRSIFCCNNSLCVLTTKKIQTSLVMSVTNKDS